MSYKDILVFAERGEAGEKRGVFAIDLAKKLDAHLTITTFAPNSLIVAYGEPGIIAPMPQDYFDELEAKATDLLSGLDEAAGHRGISVETRLIGGIAGDLPQLVAEQARYADLTIVGQPREGALWSSGGDLISEVLMNSGRPLLVIPYVGVQHQQFNTVLAAWDGSAEAARAFHDAMPFLQAAKKTILYVGEPMDRAQLFGDEPGADIARHLSRHGVNVEVRRAHSDELSVGELILSRTAADSVDLIVMGGYHHSRFRELLIGGVTKTILEHMPVPVFMSH